MLHIIHISHSKYYTLPDIILIKCLSQYLLNATNKIVPKHCIWNNQTGYTCDKNQNINVPTGQVHWLTVKVIFKSECQFPSVVSATSQLSQSQLRALHQLSIEVPFSEIWSHKMLLEMSNPLGISSISWFIQ